MGEGVHKWMHKGDLHMGSEIDVCMGRRESAYIIYVLEEGECVCMGGE